MTSFTPHPSASPLALLVDRDDDTRTMYSEYLKRASCDTDEAADGRDALAKAIARQPDVIVTDTRLPGIDGFALCELLRSDAATGAIPIIVVTGDGYPSSTARARTAGADVVLIKPCLPDVLLEEIRRVMEKSPELRGRLRRAETRRALQVGMPGEPLDPSAPHRRTFLARAHERGETKTPPAPPPELICPQCDRSLLYRHSNIGGVSARHVEQWDYYECAAGCGTFQYRHRTRRLRKA